MCSSRLAITLVGCALCSIFSNFDFVLSYLANPMKAACPRWSKSPTVIAFSLSYVFYPLASVWLGPYIQRGSFRFWAVVQAVLSGVGYLTVGVCVGFCNSLSVSPLVTETFFQIAFILLSVSYTIPLFTITFSLLRVLPNRSGFSSNYYFVLSTVGGMILVQFVLFEQTLLKQGIMAISTAWLLMGLTASFPVALSVPCFTDTPHSPVGIKHDKLASVKEGNRIMSRLDVLKTWQFYALFFAGTGIVYSFLGLLARQQNFLEVCWRAGYVAANGSQISVPIQELSFIASIAYLSGCVLWMFVSDKLTIKRSWVIASSMSVILYGFLPYFTSSTSAYAKYVAISSYCVLLIMRLATAGNTSAMCQIVYGRENAGTVWGMATLSSVIGGLVGPLTMEKLYQDSGGQFTNFLYLGAGMALVSLLATVLLRPVSFTAEAASVLPESLPSRSRSNGHAILESSAEFSK